MTAGREEREQESAKFLQHKAKGDPQRSARIAYKIIKQLLDEVEQNIVICLWRADQIIDLRDTDKSRYFAITEFNNCFIIRSPSLFF